jgi:hypothetical protein
MLETLKAVLLLATIAACGPDARPEMPLDGSATPDAIALPEGVWEPDPGLGRTNAYLVADGTGIWFLYARMAASPTSEVWLTKTTSSGDVIVPPTRVDGPGPAGWPSSIARSGENVATLYSESGPMRLRLFDRNGQPLRPEGHEIPFAAVEYPYVTSYELAARADASLRLFLAYETEAMTTELAMIELDTSGDPVGNPTLFGTADGGVPTGISAVEASGSTLVAWDRIYDICTGHFDPDATVLTALDSAGAVAPIADVNPAGRADREPFVAANGSTAYLAWTSTTDAGSVIRVSRANGSGFLELGNAPLGHRTPLLALAEPGRGAVAWITYEPALRIASITDDGTNLVAGAVHMFQLPPGAALVGIAPVGEQRYLVSWTASVFTPNQSRLFAFVVDLAVAPRPVPDAQPTSIPPRGSRRCSH